MQLRVDGGQLLVNGLQLFLGGLQLLVGGLQLFIDRLHFFVGRLQFLVSGFQFFAGCVKVLFSGLQLFSKLGNLCFGIFVDITRARLGRPLNLGFQRRRFFQNNHKQGGLRCVGGSGDYRANREVNGCEVAIGFNAYSKRSYACPGTCRFVQGRGQVAPQPFTRHFQNIVDARIPWCRLEEHARSPVQVENIALAVYQRASWCYLLQEGLFGHLTQ